ncbi:putative Ig domain-containing protein [Pedobacter sp. ASV1-7]|uniref:putative Ig domain-containing protein n=1 Tax=Pedobacter sp. ASV1-7 TaxID=3145237 RepID=UPI0032E899FD
MEKKLLLNTLALFLGINTILAQAPSINYNVSNVFIQNTLISPLNPVNTGGVVPAVAAYGQVSLFAGDISNSGSADGIGSAARFNNPYGITADSSGNIYVADRNNHKIRKITSAGVVTTLAGSGTVGHIDAIGSAASFNNPIGVTVDASGNVYVADFANHKIRKITSAGVVTTFVGSGTAGEVDGNIYVGDLTGGRKIRKITSVGTVSTIAGSEGGYLDSSVPLNARFNAPSDIVLDGNGNLYIADNASHNIRKMVLLPAGLTFNGITGTISGTPTVIFPSTDYTITAPMHH